MIYVVNISIILLCAVFLYLILKRRIEKSIDPKALINEIRVEVDRIILQMNNTTERNISLIEDKIAALSDLLDKADKKIIVLKRESEKYSMSKDYSTIIQKSKKNVIKDTKGNEPVFESDIKEKVIKLYHEGFSPSVIASHISLPVGEVELIISLMNR